MANRYTRIFDAGGSGSSRKGIGFVYSGRLQRVAGSIQGLKIDQFIELEGAADM